MDSWTCDQFVAATILLGTMLFVALLVLLYTLLKAGKLDNLLGKLSRIGHFLVPKNSPLGRRIHLNEDQILNQQRRRSKGRKTLKRGKLGGMNEKLSKQYREQLNKAWIDRHREEMCRKMPHATNVNETSHGEKLSYELINLFWIERKDSVNSGKTPHFSHQRMRRQISPLLKYIPTGKPVKPVKQVQPVRCLPETQLTQGQENHGFMCDGLNEVEQGLEPRAAKAGQYQNVTRSPDWPSRDIRLAEDIV